MLNEYAKALDGMPQALEGTANVRTDFAGMNGWPNPAPYPASRVSTTRQGVKRTKFVIVCPCKGMTVARPANPPKTIANFDTILASGPEENITVRKQPCPCGSPRLFGKHRGHVTLVGNSLEV